MLGGYVCKHSGRAQQTMLYLPALLAALLVIQQPDIDDEITFIWKFLQACIFWDCLL